MKTIYTLWALLFTTMLAAQTAHWRIRGMVLNEQGEPLPGAMILADESIRTVSDADGVFELNLETRPRMLSARVLGYFSQRILLDTILWKGRRTALQFVLQSSDMALQEVTISSKPVESVYEEHYQSVLLDYLFAGPDLLLLLREKKTFSLRLVKDNGEQLADLALPTAGQHTLHRSCTGAFHLVGDVWAWELAIGQGHIDTFPRYPAQHFYRYIEPCILQKDGYYFCRKMGAFNQSVRYFCIDPQGNIKLLDHIRDLQGERSAWGLYLDFMNKTPFMAPRTYELTGSPFNAAQPAYLFALPEIPLLLEGEPWQVQLAVSTLIRSLDPYNNDQLATLGALQNMTADSVYAPMFCLRDTIVLLDHVNNRLLRLQPETGTNRTDTLYFHRQAGGWRKIVLFDEPLQRLYGFFYTNQSGITLTEINTNTGAGGKSYPLPLAPAIASHFKIRNGTLYCIGQPDINNPNRHLYKFNLY